jgi:hypothetical protein
MIHQEEVWPSIQDLLELCPVRDEVALSHAFSAQPHGEIDGC